MSGNLNLSYGTDGVGDVVFNLPATALTSGGQDVQYWLSADGHTLVGYVLENYEQSETQLFSESSENDDYIPQTYVKVIFSAEITNVATGAFSFTLYGPLDHPDVTTEDNLLIPLSFTVTDSNGDSAVGTLSVNVDDDSPIPSGEDGEGGQLYMAVEEETVPTGEHGNDENEGLYYTNTQNVTYSGAVNWGADGFGAVTAVTVRDAEPVAIGENGYATVYFNADGEYQSSSIDAAAQLDVNSDGYYTFTVLTAMNHAPGEGENQLNLPAITITAVDGDGDPVNVPLNISVQDDVPVLLGSTEPTDQPQDYVQTAMLSVAPPPSSIPGPGEGGNSLINGLGGTAEFGETMPMSRNDDGSSARSTLPRSLEVVA